MTDNSKTHADGWRPCEAKGCNRRAQGFSRWCPTHRGRAHYTRDPHGRILRKGRDLGPYREMVAEYMPKWKAHPAIVKAHQFLESLLTRGSTYSGSSRTHRAIAKELRRMQADGATGPAMLARVLAVEGYAYFHPHDWDDGPCHTANIGHGLTHTTPRPGSAKAPGPAIYALGREVRDALGLLPHEFWSAVEREIHRTEHTREGIAQALQGEPLA